MSQFRVNLGVANPTGEQSIPVSALVDTGAHHTMLPESLLSQLGIAPIIERNFVFADGNTKTLGIGQAKIAFDGYEMVCPVIFGPDERYLLGVSTLEIFSLTVDPVNQELVPVEFEGRPI
jgi:clan AA aspartic protease